MCVCVCVCVWAESEVLLKQLLTVVKCHTQIEHLHHFHCTERSQQTEPARNGKKMSRGNERGERREEGG